MAEPLRVPDLGSEAVRLSAWLVAVGEPVYEGERVVELSFPGAVVDLSAPCDGTLISADAHPGDPLQPGQVLGTIQPVT
jgi:2-oxoglutarate dehydrogenase E2 component (dihydrolipoamide succinyltransferase)/2-oxoisovalerate dehydrogenase E2 component (dihydrolipoyl transacylase)